jgi:MYXO-CTERM domain-containing protein
MRISCLAVAAGAIALLCARPASANGRFPQSNQIVFSPKDPNLVVTRATYAILPSYDNGQSWRFLCENVLGLPDRSPQDPELAFTANGALIAGNFSPTRGLNVSNDVGCNWTCAGGALAGQAIADVVVRPDSPHTVLAVTGTLLPSNGGPRTSDSQVFQSMDDGATWAALGQPIDPSWTVNTIEVSKSDPKRIYVSAWKGVNDSRVVTMFVSSDSGQTWTSRPVPPSLFDNTMEDQVWIGGVDPIDADRVYLRSNVFDPLAAGKSRLYMTTDGGKTYTEPKSFDLHAPQMMLLVGELLGFALSPDGSKIYVGNSQGGLFVADRATMTFTQTSSIDIHCLATRESPTGATELWACTDAWTSVSTGIQYTVGMSTDDGAHFAQKLGANSGLCGPVTCQASGTLGCGADASGATCGGAYMDWCNGGNDDPLYPCGTCPGATGLDAGAADAGLSRSSSSSCGCSVPGASGGVLAGLLAILAVPTAALIRKRRRP